MVLLLITAMICGGFSVQYLFIDLVAGIDKSKTEKFFIYSASYNEKPKRFIIGRLIKFTLSAAGFFIFFKLVTLEMDDGVFASLKFFPIFLGYVLLYLFALIAHLRNFKSFKPDK